MSDEQVTEAERFQVMAARLRNGNEGSLEEILRELGPSLATRLKKQFSSLLTAEDIDDVLAQMLFRLWEHRADYRAELAPFSLWCYLIARNIALDEIRNKVRRNASLSALWSELRGSHLPSEPVNPSPLLNALGRALSMLAPDERQILLASVSGEEAWAAKLAPALGQSANALRQRRFRAMSKVRKELTRLGFSPPENKETLDESPMG
jgi:RNA polymerase sigma factor (sigma-70 family)